MQVATVLETGRELRGGTVDHLTPAYVNPSVRSVYLSSIHQPTSTSQISMPPIYSPVYINPAYVNPSVRSACLSSIHQLTLPISQISLLPLYSPAYFNPSVRSVCLPSTHQLTLTISQISLLSIHQLTLTHQSGLATSPLFTSLH